MLVYFFWFKNSKIALIKSSKDFQNITSMYSVMINKIKIADKRISSGVILLDLIDDKKPLSGRG
jgi:hypothetical protein